MDPIVGKSQLHVEPFEEYMLVDDRPSFPMNFFVRLKTSGRLDESALRQAVEVAVSRHPLLTLIVGNKKRGRLSWVSDEGNGNGVDWSDGPDVDDFPSAKWLNVRETAGLRVRVFVGQDHSDLVLQFHHSCCDAVGAYQFASDLLVAYAAQVAGDPADTEMSPLDSDRLAVRGQFGMTLWKWIKLTPRQLFGLGGALCFFMRTPVPIVPHEPALDHGLYPEYPAVVVHSFDSSETDAILAAAKQQNATVNDLLARDLFSAISEFRCRASLGNPSEWLRLNVPMNLRTGDDNLTSAANILSMVFLDRRPRDCGNRQALLKAIHEQMAKVKRRRLGYTFILFLRAARALPGGMVRAGKNVRCRATAVLSNVGRPLDHCPLPHRDGRLVAGNVIVTRTEFVPPIRPYTSVAFSITTYCGQMVLALHYAPSVLGSVQARDLIDTYVRFVHDSIGQP